MAGRLYRNYSSVRCQRLRLLPEAFVSSPTNSTGVDGEVKQFAVEVPLTTKMHVTA